MAAKQHELNLLIVEDDAGLAAALKILASDYFKVFVAQKPSLIPDHVFFHAALIDLHLEVAPPENSDGLKVIQSLIKKNPQLEIIAISGNLDRLLMEKSIQAGAQRFLAKPLSEIEVKTVLEKISAYWQLRTAPFDLQKKSIQLIGTSAECEKLRRQIAALKSEKTPVLIEGETGVGKDIVAQLINKQETTAPFITVNCSALTENIFESEFFGHVKGAFTGADSNKIGFAEAANGGDLFLDEIEALPLSQQAKLLRFIESGEVRKVGAKDSFHVQVRIIAAGNIPLKQLVLEKKFREDLYFRLSSHIIEIAPLRERIDDIAVLANFFIESERPRRNKTFDDSAINCLTKYKWPGNVRELKRICEQLTLLSPLPVIRESDVKNIIYPQMHNTGSTAQMTLNNSLEEFLKNQEKSFIEFCLSETKDIDKSCDVLKISKSSLYKKIKDLGIKND